MVFLGSNNHLDNIDLFLNSTLTNFIGLPNHGSSFDCMLEVCYEYVMISKYKLSH